MRPTALDIFGKLPPGAQNEMINDLALDIGMSVLGQLEGHYLFAEWLCCELLGDSHVNVEITLRQRESSECAACGGPAYHYRYPSSDVVETRCERCGVTGRLITPERKSIEDDLVF